MASSLTTRARAKINLSLIVHGRRADGYHELTSLVMFAGVGDRLTLDPHRPPGLAINGPFANGLEAGDGNLVLRAVTGLQRRFPGLKSGHFTLTKRLPIASGIGGGSADAAAALRLLARLNGLRTGHPALMEAARETGADVPVCLGSRTVTMRGIGEALGPALALPPLPAVLVNPGVAVATAAVFAGLGLKPGDSLPPSKAASAGNGAGFWHEDGPEDADALVAALKDGHGNDLEAPARRIEPVIGEVLTTLESLHGCRLSRMSGSGATCFGLFATGHDAASAARHLSRLQPGWWVKATVLG